MENFWTYFEVIAPSIGVGLIFWFAMRAIFRADRNERAAEAQVREQHAETRAVAEQHAKPAARTDSAASSSRSPQPPRS